MSVGRSRCRRTGRGFARRAIIGVGKCVRLYSRLPKRRIAISYARGMRLRSGLAPSGEAGGTKSTRVRPGNLWARRAYLAKKRRIHRAERGVFEGVCSSSLDTPCQTSAIIGGYDASRCGVAGKEVGLGGRGETACILPEQVCAKPWPSANRRRGRTGRVLLAVNMASDRQPAFVPRPPDLLSLNTSLRLCGTTIDQRVACLEEEISSSRSSIIYPQATTTHNGYRL